MTKPVDNSTDAVSQLHQMYKPTGYRGRHSRQLTIWATNGSLRLRILSTLCIRCDL